MDHRLLSEWFDTDELHVTGTPEAIDGILEAMVKKLRQKLDQHGISVCSDMFEVGDHRWNLVVCQLSLLTHLHECSQEKTLDDGSLAESMSFKQTVLKSTQLIVALGLCPYLQPGVGVSLATRSDVALLFAAGMPDLSWDRKQRRLLTVIRHLVQVLRAPALALIICERHLSDVIAGLGQLGHSQRLSDVTARGGDVTAGGGDVTEEERRLCRCDLHHLLERLFQPLVIRELLLLQGAPITTNKSRDDVTAPVAPRWLRVLCAHLLCERLMTSRGVTWLLQAVDAPVSSDSGAGWRRTEALAKVIVHCPKKDKVAYYRAVSTQLLEILHDSEVCSSRKKVAIATVRELHQQQPLLAHELLMCKLGYCLPSEEKVKDQLCDQPVVLLNSSKLETTVRVMHEVYTTSPPPGKAFLRQLLPSIPCLTLVLLSTHISGGELRRQCEELLLVYLRAADVKQAVIVLQSCLDADVTQGSGARCVADENGRLQLAVPFRQLESSDVMDVYAWQQHALKVVKLLQKLQSADVTSQFLLSLLKKLTACLSDTADNYDVILPSGSHSPRRLADIRRHVILMYTISAVTETMQGNVFQNVEEILVFLKTTLERLLVMLRNTADQFSVTGKETLQLCLSLLTALLYSDKVKGKHASWLEPFLPLLQHIHDAHVTENTRTEIADLRVAIATHGALRNSTVAKETLKPATAAQEKRLVEEMGHCSMDDQRSEYSAAMREVTDLLLPIKGHGLIALKQLILQRDPVTLDHAGDLVTVFHEQLVHTDSYVYLAAINGLAALGDTQCKKVVPLLAEEFRKDVLSVENKIKLGEVIVKVVRNLGEMAPAYSDVIMASLLTGTRHADGLVRTSSLSNIGEVCKLLNFSLGKVATEVLECSGALVRSDLDPGVRQAAVYLLYLLLQGMTSHTLLQHDVTVRDVARTLRHVRATQTRPEVLRLTALALEELDKVTREFIQPSHKLEKRIFVLDAPK